MRRPCAYANRGLIDRNARSTHVLKGECVDPSHPPSLGFGLGNMDATNATMADIPEAMQQGALDRPVVDQTGLTGGLISV